MRRREARVPFSLSRSSPGFGFPAIRSAVKVLSPAELVIGRLLVASVDHRVGHGLRRPVVFVAPTAALVTWIWLDEAPTMAPVVGAVISLTGVRIATMETKVPEELPF